MKSKEQELLDKLDPSTDETDVRSFADVVKVRLDIVNLFLTDKCAHVNIFLISSRYFSLKVNNKIGSTIEVDAQSVKKTRATP